MINKLLIFRLYGDFAHFNMPVGNRVRNTFSIISKPQLLGVIGAIIGLKGYEGNETFPQFYELLGNLKVFINNKKFLIKTVSVKYNSLNSFLYNRTDTGSPNKIINEQVLVDVDYEIGLLLDEDNELHKEIIKRIKDNSCVFNPYLGKNEFPACVEYISLNDYEINTKKEVTCQSIFPFDIIEKSNGNIRLDNYPVDFDEHFKYVYCTMGIPEKKSSITLKNPDDCIVSDGKIYYVF